MKKRKAVHSPTHREQSRRSLLVWVVFLALVTGIAGWRIWQQTGTRGAESPKAARTVTPQPIGWPIADLLLHNREAYRKDLDLDSLRGWSGYTREYFLSLVTRRETIQVWAHDQPKKLKIHFMGQMHVNLAGGNTPESMRRIDEFQTDLFERLKREVHDASVIAIEEQGADEPLTPEIYQRISRDALRSKGLDVADEEIWNWMRQDQQASARAIMELSNQIPVICGEEWSLSLQASLLSRKNAPLDDRRQKAMDHFVAVFSTLRSEIILIRSLEFLRKSGGSKAIIIQGGWHQQDMEQLAPEYRVSLTTEPLSPQAGL